MGATIFNGALSLLLFSLIAAAAGRDLWCVAKNNAEDAALQSALDWACGPGQADCGPIQNDGPCYDALDLQRTASYAFNQYYLRNGPADDSCYFSNNAALTDLDPSYDNCRFVSSKSSDNGNFSGPVIGGPDGAFLSSRGWVAITHWDWGLFAIFAILWTL